jgi:heme o synthase
MSSVIVERAAIKTSRLSNYVELTKPRIAVMVLFTVWMAALVNGAQWSHFAQVFHAIVGTFLIAASGSAWNQYVERFSDFYMERTRSRPLPAGQLSAIEVVQFGTITFAVGIVYLAALVNITATMLALASWVIYVWIYTPLKALTWTNTIVGAVAGAMPILIGAAAMNAPWGFMSLTLFSVLFLWQFPHFMAIAWKYRHDYATGGLKMLTNVDSSGRAAGWCAVITALAMLPVMCLPFTSFSPYSANSVAWLALGLLMVVIMGVAYLHRSIRFLRDRNLVTAKSLMRCSLLILPLYFLLVGLYCVYFAELSSVP